MLIIFCFALAWAIRGTVTQTWSDGRAAAGSARQAVKARTAKARQSRSRNVRYAANTATVAGVLAGGTARVLWGVGRSMVKGARDGWAKGRSRAIARREDRLARRRGSHDDPAPPGWANYVTGRCPWCQHLPAATAEETDGCACENIDWGCQCALRNRSRERIRVDTPHPPDETSWEPVTAPISEPLEVVPEHIARVLQGSCVYFAGDARSGAARTR